MDASKPAPDIVRASPAVGLLCGGISEAELRAAGGSSVAADPAALLRDLDSWLPHPAEG